MERTQLWDRFNTYSLPSPEVGTKKPKPDPNVYLYALEQFRCDPRDAVVIEDSVFGVTAARRAGARVIGFTGASHAWTGLADLLTEAGAETVVSRLAEVPRVAEAFAMWDGVDS
jgi:beta-phosphoglucomutase-like phosphatase (HAD superfamily)